MTGIGEAVMGDRKEKPLFDVGDPVPRELEIPFEEDPPRQPDIDKLSPRLPFQCKHGAIISPCSKFRYLLWRKIRQEGAIVTYISLNPSTADADSDDPTVRRLAGFTDRWRYSKMNLVNLFAFRSTDPKNLKRAEDPIGPENNAHIVAAVEESILTVLCWGNGGHLRGRARAVCDLVYEKCPSAKIVHFGLTKRLFPRHPLYIRNDTPLRDYRHGSCFGMTREEKEIDL
jgi:hypothetical protein